MIATTDRKTQLLALAFMLMLTLTACSFFQIEPVTATGSQTKHVYASGAPTYTYGTSSSGDYTNTFSPDINYHVSTSASYTGSPSTQAKYVGAGTQATSPWSGSAWVNPTYIQGQYGGGGDYSYSDVQADWANSNSLYGEGFGFTLGSSMTPTGIYVRVYRVAGTASVICDYGIKIVKGGAVLGDNKASSGWWAVSPNWEYVYYGGSTDLWGLSWAYSDINSANFGLCLAAINKGMSHAYAYIAEIYITVYYNTTYYRIDYYYNFIFSTSARSSVSQLDYLINGILSTSLVWFSVGLWNWTSNAWVYAWSNTYTGLAQGGENGISINSYMASNGSMRIRLYSEDNVYTSSFDVDIDTMYFYVTYTPLTPTTPTLSSPADGQTLASSSVTLSWTGTDTYFSKYQLQRATNDAFTTGLINSDHTNTSQVWSGRTTGTYYWRLRIMNTYGDVSNWTSRRFMVDITSPSAPTLSSPATSSPISIRDGSIKFLWQSVSDATAYWFQLDDDSAFGSTLVSTSATTTDYTFSSMGSLVSGTTYYWHVKSQDAAGNWGSYSGNYHIHAYDPLAVPLLSNPADKATTKETSITFSWSISGFGDTVSTYTLLISSDSGFIGNVETHATASTSHIVTLTTNTWYWKVRAYGSLGVYSNWSLTRQLIVDAVAPGKVVLFYPSNGSAVTYQPLVMWNESSDALSGLKQYHLQVSTSAAFGTTIVNITTDEVWYQFTTYQLSIFYWRVRAVDNAGNIGVWSNTWWMYATADPQIYVSLFDLDAAGVALDTVKLYVNGSRYTIPYFLIPQPLGIKLNITVTDFLNNELFQKMYTINATPTYIDIDLQLVSVTLTAYGPSMVNITSSGMIKTFSFDGSMTTKLKPNTYTFSGTANNGTMPFNKVVTITTSLNRLVTLCDSRGTAYIKFVNSNDPNHKALSPMDFDARYYLPSRGSWKFLSPYIPMFDMFLGEKVNITVYDNLGSVVINNQQFSYNDTIQVQINVWSLRVIPAAEYGAAIVFVQRHDQALAGGIGVTATWGYEAMLYPGLYDIDVWFNYTIASGHIVPISLWINQTITLPGTIGTWVGGIYVPGTQQTGRIVMIASGEIQDIMDWVNGTLFSVDTLTASINEAKYYLNSATTTMNTAKDNMNTFTTDFKSYVNDQIMSLNKPNGILPSPLETASIIGSVMAFSFTVIPTIIGIGAWIRRLTKGYREYEAHKKQEVRDQNEGKQLPGTNISPETAGLGTASEEKLRRKHDSKRKRKEGVSSTPGMEV